jgi:hypothetical protein
MLGTERFKNQGGFVREIRYRQIKLIKIIISLKSFKNYCNNLKKII